jgi:hypothetical protein
MYMQSTLHNAPDLCKNVSLAVLFGSNGNSYKICMQSGVCLDTHIFFIIEKSVGENKSKILGQQ